MSEEERKLEPPDPEGEIPTVVPARSRETTAKEWTMPEPEFRRTSGYLPQGFAKRFPIGGADGSKPSAPPPVDPFLQTFVGTPGMSTGDFASEAPAAPAAAKIEPQPDVAEVALPEDEPAEPAPVKKKRSRTAKFVIAVLLIIAAGMFIIIFLAVVYVLFLAPSGDLPTLE